MELFLWLMAIISTFSFHRSQAMVTNMTVLNLISWQEAIEEVNRTNSLAQVLKEYLDDIETVEAATSQCAKKHRDRYSSGEVILRTKLDLCVKSSNNQRKALVQCVEDNTRSTVSDVRQYIIQLKNCVDGS